MRALCLCVFVFVMTACSSSSTDPAEMAIDAGVTDTGGADGGTTDSGTTDSGTTDSGTTDSGTTDVGAVPVVQNSCESVSVVELNQNGGAINTVLPAELSAPGAEINIDLVPDGELLGFDSLSGQLDYAPGPGRLARTIEYHVIDGNSDVTAHHKHHWVFQPTRIMPLGDSITSGVEYFDGTDLPPRNLRTGYRQFLYDDLLAAGYQVDFQGQGGQSAGEDAGLLDPENNGYPGVDIDFLLSKLLEQLTEDNPDIILLHIGTNNTPDNALGIESWLDALDEWEQNNHPVVALVATIVPKRDPVKNAVVDAFNADLRQRVLNRSDDLVYLVEQNLAVSVDDISDEPIGLHPNKTGYRKMADAWFNALTSTGALANCD